MKTNRDNQEQEEMESELFELMTAELDHKITPEQSNRLSEMLMESWAYKEWEKFQETFAKEDAADRMRQRSKQQPPDDLLKTLKKDDQKRNLLITGALIIALSLLLPRLRYSKPASPSPVTARTLIAPLTKSIVVQIMNGPALPLNGSDTLITGNAAFYEDTLQHIVHFAALPASKAETCFLQVPAGRNTSLYLADGSLVQLNAESRLSFPVVFTGSKREVQLTGEAYFTVAKAADKPFIVHSPRTQIEVLGTAFNVNAYQDNNEKISVQEGRVQVISGRNSKSAILEKGQQATVIPGKEIQVAAFKKEELSWREGEYNFYDMPVNELPALLHRCYDVQIVIDDPKMAGETFTGVLNIHSPLSDFLDQLKLTLKIKHSYTDEKGVLHLKR